MIISYFIRFFKGFGIKRRVFVHNFFDFVLSLRLGVLTMEYSFNVFNAYSSDGICSSVNRALLGLQKTKTSLPPVVVCIGSDLAIGDALGPVCGSMLCHKTQGLNSFIYGTLSAPVTAKEIKHIRAFLKETHKSSPIVAIDAAVGDAGDVGLIKIIDKPLQPGAGANKKLGSIGDISIMGIVAEKSIKSYALFNTTRLNLVYKMSETIADALSTLLWNANA